MKHPRPAQARSLYRRLLSSPKFQRATIYLIHESKFEEWTRENPCDESTGRFDLFRSVIDREALHGPIDYLEFGVFQGESIRWWAENNRHPESTFVGFDCFEGLPEDWQSLPKGSFSVSGAIPDIQDPRCSFVKGMFQDTLPGWLNGRGFPRRALVHLDADLYSSTLFVLIHLLPRIKKGDILIFDQFADYAQRIQGVPGCDDGLSRAVRGAGPQRGLDPGRHEGERSGVTTMKILLTGGAGYVGSACLRWLLEHGHDPIAYDNLSEGNRRGGPRRREPADRRRHRRHRPPGRR